MSQGRNRHEAQDHESRNNIQKESGERSLGASKTRRHARGSGLLATLIQETAARMRAIEKSQEKDAWAHAKEAYEFDRRSRGARKKALNGEDAFKELAAEMRKDGSTATAATLRLDAGAYALFMELGGEAMAPRLTVSHYAEVRRGWLREGNHHVDLIQKAARDHLSTRELRAEVAKLRGPKPAADWSEEFHAFLNRIWSMSAEQRRKIADEKREISPDDRKRISHIAVFYHQWSEAGSTPPAKAVSP